MPWTHDTKPLLITKGPLILSLESVFWHWQRYPKRRVASETPPLHELARPREVEQPYRLGHGHAFRIPLTRRGLVLGYWVPPELEVLEEEESQRLLDAVEGAMIPDVTATEISTWSRGRLSWWVRLVGWLQDNYLGFLAPKPPAPPVRAREAVAELVDDTGVIPYDGRVYDLEDARVEPPGKPA